MAEGTNSGYWQCVYCPHYYDRRSFTRHVYSCGKKSGDTAEQRTQKRVYALSTPPLQRCPYVDYSSVLLPNRYPWPLIKTLPPEDLLTQTETDEDREHHTAVKTRLENQPKVEKRDETNPFAGLIVLFLLVWLAYLIAEAEESKRALQRRKERPTQHLKVETVQEDAHSGYSTFSSEAPIKPSKEFYQSIFGIGM